MVVTRFRFKKMGQINMRTPSHFTHSTALRYLRLTLLVAAIGTIYPLLYLRQNFELTILSSFNISIIELCQCYSLMGVIFFLSYLPGGWLADRFSPHNLIFFSLVMVGLLGLWFSTFPRGQALKLIFIGWGLSAGLTFWASLLKAVKALAADNEQSRFFGLLDGGRWLCEAMLASIGLAIFMSYLEHDGDTELALQQVIYMYCFACFGVAALVFIFFRKEEVTLEQNPRHHAHLFSDLKAVFANRQIWLTALIIFCGYQLYWATYSFSAYLQQCHGLTSVTVGFIMMGSLWMGAVGGIGGGFLGDYFSKETVLGCCQLFASAGLLCLTVFLQTGNTPALVGMVLLNSIFIGAVRGIYWSLLNACRLSGAITGLAIGLISVIAYLPDILLPLLGAEINKYYPGVLGSQFYFGYIAVCGFIGAGATFYFKKIY